MKTLSLLITGLLACTGNIYDENGQVREEVREFVEENNLNLGGENGPYWKNKRNLFCWKKTYLKETLVWLDFLLYALSELIDFELLHSVDCIVECIACV